MPTPPTARRRLLRVPGPAHRRTSSAHCRGDPRVPGARGAARSPTTTGTAPSSRSTSSPDRRARHCSAPRSPRRARFENSACTAAGSRWRSLASTPSTATFVGVHSGLAMTSIAVGGSPEQRAEWLPPMAPRRADRRLRAHRAAVTAPTPRAACARPREPHAATPWVLNGAKRWIGNATFADVVVIWARDIADDQVKGFLVRTRHRRASRRRRSSASSRCAPSRTPTSLLDGRVVTEARPAAATSTASATSPIVLRLTRARGRVAGASASPSARTRPPSRTRRRASSSASRSRRSSWCRSSSPTRLGEHHRVHRACACASPSCRTRAGRATTTPRWPRRS